MQQRVKILVTIAVVAIAAIAVFLKYRTYVANPWTRDGQVRADIIQVTSRVSGPIVALPIVDNQKVKSGDLLFRIDPRTYKAAVDQAQAQYDLTIEQLEGLDQQIEASKASVAQAQSQIKQAETQITASAASVVQSRAELERYEVLVRDGNISHSVYDQQRKTYDVDAANLNRAQAALTQSQSAKTQADAELAAAITKRGAHGNENAQLRAAAATLEQAKLNLEFTEQRASVDGYVTNLTLQLGSQANAGSPALALVDSNSYWIDGYFKETVIGTMKVGDPAFVTLMGDPDPVLEGVVQSIAWGIARQDGSAAQSLLPSVQPSFEWIRLAQRIPVKIKLKAIPESTRLRVGTTASVLVHTGGGSTPAYVPPTPSALR